MPKITGPSQTANTCAPKDTTAPPTPQIVTTMAFDRAKEGSRVGHQRNVGAGFSTGRRDPVYIELRNVELGSSIEMINLSANPRAEFSKENTIKLELTGREARAREGAVYLSQAQMEKLGLKPGDMYQLRAVDAAGNASAPVSGELQPNEWANADVIEDNRFIGVRGSELRALDGEGQRKAIVAKAVNDARPPMVQADHVSIETKGNGHTEMVFDRAIEPGAHVSVLNTRDGKSVAGVVDEKGQLSLALKGLNDGDPLLVSVRDNNDVQGQQLEVVYSSRCKDGKAPSLKGGLGARLGGVI